ncbi:hypothetical protein HKBW3S43_01329, partial [Candidatus Hakubella thermalkaliphila]
DAKEIVFWLMAKGAALRYRGLAGLADCRQLFALRLEGRLGARRHDGTWHDGWLGRLGIQSLRMDRYDLHVVVPTGISGPADPGRRMAIPAGNSAGACGGAAPGHVGQSLPKLQQARPDRLAALPLLWTRTDLRR